MCPSCENWEMITISWRKRGTCTASFISIPAQQLKEIEDRTETKSILVTKLSFVMKQKKGHHSALKLPSRQCLRKGQTWIRACQSNTSTTASFSSFPFSFDMRSKQWHNILQLSLF
jgi:hypothetical protein